MRHPGQRSRNFHSAQEQTIALDWHESPGPPGNRLIVDVRCFVVRSNGWTVFATVKNDSRATLVISRRHRRHGTECGILLLGLGSFGASGAIRPPLSMRFEYITDHAFRLPGNL